MPAYGVAKNMVGQFARSLTTKITKAHDGNPDITSLRDTLCPWWLRGPLLAIAKRTTRNAGRMPKGRQFGYNPRSHEPRVQQTVQPRIGPRHGVARVRARRAADPGFSDLHGTVF